MSKLGPRVTLFKVMEQINHRSAALDWKTGIMQHVLYNLRWKFPFIQENTFKLLTGCFKGKHVLFITLKHLAGCLLENYVVIMLTLYYETYYNITNVVLTWGQKLRRDTIMPSIEFFSWSSLRGAVHPQGAEWSWGDDPHPCRRKFTRLMKILSIQM